MLSLAKAGSDTSRCAFSARYSHSGYRHASRKTGRDNTSEQALMSSHRLQFFLHSFSLAGKPKFATEPFHTKKAGKSVSCWRQQLRPRALFPVFCLNTVKCFLLAGSNSRAPENSCSGANPDQLTLYSSPAHPSRTQRAVCNNWCGRASLPGRWQFWLLYDQADLCKEMRTPHGPICQVICLYSETCNISCFMLMDWRTNTVLKSEIHTCSMDVVSDYSMW